MQQSISFVCFIIEINMMIKGIIKNSVSVFLAAIVLIATSGFTVLRHSCQAQDTTEFSLFIPEFNCEHQGNQEKSTIHSCCSIPVLPASETYDTEKCCDTDTFLVKLDVTFDIHHLTKKAIPADFDHPVERAHELEIPDGEITHIIISNDLPPPLGGKSLHIFLNQLNIPFPSV